MTETTTRTSICPICGRATTLELRPFCSKRCADVDLGRWFTGQYRTPSSRIEFDPDDEEPAGPPA